MTSSRAVTTEAATGREETERSALLEVSGLRTAFPTRAGIAYAVAGVSFDLAPGECLGLVGESGSGKSMTCRSLLGLVPRPGAIVDGSIRWRGEELVGADERRLRRIRGGEIGMIFQDPASALNPVYTIGSQIVETIVTHTSRGRTAARRDVIDLLGSVGIPSPRERSRAYPHELSGGMRQRAMIALAIACHPLLILADEPTTNLDVTIQDQILHLLADLRAEREMAMILVSHDLAHVFEPLYRGETSRNRQTGGAGLGLTIARRIFQAHGGDLAAANAPEGGAVFTGTLPARGDLAGPARRGPDGRASPSAPWASWSRRP